MKKEGLNEVAEGLTAGVPVLLLTAHDPLAPLVARHYAAHLAAAGRPINEISLAENAANEMESWLRSNPPAGVEPVAATEDPREEAPAEQPESNVVDWLSKETE